MKDEPAFPQSYRIGGSSSQVDASGLTMRDYFAAAALQSVSCGIIAETNHGTTAESLAATAYSIADAMIAARNT